MVTTASEKPKTRSHLARLAGVGPVSPVAILGGVLVGYAAFALLLGGAVAVLRHRGSGLDLTKGWEELGTRGGLLIGALLFLAYLLAGYMAGRMAWRQGIVHGIGVFAGSLVVVGAVVLLVRSLTRPKDVKAITDALHSFGIPTTRDEWRHVDSVVEFASLGGMLLGSVIGGLAGQRWYTKVSRRLRVAEAAEIDVRDRPVEDNGRANGTANGRVDIDELSKDELYHRAQELDIPGRSQMSKDELRKALQKQG
jgi:hypothetical protein